MGWVNQVASDPQKAGAVCLIRVDLIQKKVKKE